jgi:peptidoglycan/xylan/chitin deacetylase (PgdA/CDA1 family)
MIGLSVDDGPVGLDGASNALYDFLKQNNQKITHFMIGENILNNPATFLRAFQELDGVFHVYFALLSPILLSFEFHQLRMIRFTDT